MLQHTSHDEVFKRCTLCGKEWGIGEEFLSDMDVFLDGRQANAMKWFVDLKEHGILLFVHNKADCGSTLVLTAEMFHQEQNNHILR